MTLMTHFFCKPTTKQTVDWKEMSVFVGWDVKVSRVRYLVGLSCRAFLFISSSVIGFSLFLCFCLKHQSYPPIPRNTLTAIEIRPPHPL